MLHWVQSHWHLIHWGDASAYLGIVVTATFGFLSWRSSQRSKKSVVEAKAEADRAERATKAAEDAAESSRRSADASERSALAGERSATAGETQARLLQSQADAAEQKPWRVERRGGMDFRLVNRIATAKYEVVVNGEPARTPPGVFRPGGGRANQFEVVDGHETVELDLFVAAQTMDRAVTVSWRPTPGHTGDPWTQRCGLD